MKSIYAPKLDPMCAHRMFKEKRTSVSVLADMMNEGLLTKDEVFSKLERWFYHNPKKNRNLES